MAKTCKTVFKHEKMAKKAKIGKNRQKMAQKWQKLAFFIDFSIFFQILITLRKILAKSSSTPKMKDFVPIFQSKQSFNPISYGGGRRG